MVYELMIKEVRAKLSIGTDSWGCVQPPCSALDIESLVEKVKRHLAANLPHESARFLSLCDGLSFDDLRVYSSNDKTRTKNGKEVVYLHGLVEANLSWRPGPDLNSLLLFANDAFCFYGLDVVEGRYARWGKGTLEREIEFAGFDEMLVGALTTALKRAQ